MAVPAAPAETDDAPLLQQMPTDFQRALPPLRVSIHVYAPDPSQRILFINNRQYHQGDRVDGNIRVEEIVPDGVILSFQGQRFKLGRPR
ncbi:general secretion pathway protein GspB [Sulfuricaulis sp.]